MIGSFFSPACFTFYELLIFQYRLIMQCTTDDASHDEALASRVAALNLWDLDLGHEIGEAINKVELGAVVKACGDSEYFLYLLRSLPI
jgi:hypothetical protein